MLVRQDLTIQEKLEILTDAAKYDVACTSSGIKRGRKSGNAGKCSRSRNLP